MERQTQYHNHRQHVRTDCHIKTQVTWDGRSFSGTIINQSVNSDIQYFCVHFSGQFPYAEPGEDCLLLFGDDNQHKYTTKTVRVGSDRLVLAAPTVRSGRTVRFLLSTKELIMKLISRNTNDHPKVV